MNAFTEQQLKELETIYGLVRKPGIIPVRDGHITEGDKVWWRSINGPEQVNSSGDEHRQNIINYPNAYQISKPQTTVTYSD